jgi:hypothetical protein
MIARYIDTIRPSGARIISRSIVAMPAGRQSESYCRRQEERMA